MHLLRAQAGRIEDGSEPVNLDQSPGEIVVLSAADTEIAGLSRAQAALGADAPSLRLANLSALSHPYSVDLYLEKTLRHARLIVLRLIGGAGYWRYGTDELVALARGRGIALAVLSGTGARDADLEALSTLPAPAVGLFADYFVHGGPDNLRNALRYAAHLLGRGDAPEAPRALPKAGLYTPAFLHLSPRGRGRREAPGEGVRAFADTARSVPPHPNPLPSGERASSVAAAPASDASAGRAAIVFYRALMQAGDLAPVDALAEALAARGIEALPLFVSSPKDAEAAGFLRARLAEFAPDAVLNATAFAIGQPGDAWRGTPLDATGAPILQVIFSGASEATWRASARGLSPSDIAMHVALPEVDGRIVTRAVSFKAERHFDRATQAPVVAHRPIADRIGFVADLAASYARLRRTPRAERRIGLVLSNYPSSDGRIANAVGLDTPESAVAILHALGQAGYDVEDVPPDGDALIARLMEGPGAGGHCGRPVRERLARADYDAAAETTARWGAPEDDPFFTGDAFAVPAFRCGKVAVMLQPARGFAVDAKLAQHDLDLVPMHGYVAAYRWLRHGFDPHAIVHLGKHGSLEWTPGKALALTQACWPERLLGPVPHIYPFIANDPGEGAQAKRRAHVVVVDHMVPPIRNAETYGPLRDLEALIDEYADAVDLDPRRAALLARDIVELARASGLDADCGIAADEDGAGVLAKLDAFLCDLKDLSVRDGLHVFGRGAQGEARDDLISALARGNPTVAADEIAARLDACGAREMEALLTALDGRFVAPGPSGAPTRGRIDVLPTGRNFYSVDTRAVPTRAAWRIAQKTAEALVLAYTQEHGRFPARIALTAWGTANMRTGGDDVATALALIGVVPQWDEVSKRVTGFEITPLSALKRPRIDVVFRISGFFRDAFPSQIDLIASAIRAVAALDEPASSNPIAADPDTPRVFGSAPGRYGAGLKDLIETGRWEGRGDLAAAYLEASGYAYGGGAEGTHAHAALRAMLGRTDAVMHAQDAREFDLLDSTDYYEFEGGLAAAVEAASGAAAPVYHADTSGAEGPRIRRLESELALIVRARAANPRWLAAMRAHGHRGGGEMAASVIALVGFSATTGLVTDAQFEAVYDAMIGDAENERFLAERNPAALAEMRARFTDAVTRGLWRPRRNSITADLMEGKP